MGDSDGGGALQVIFSKVLSAGVIAGSLVGKCPQILCIVRARSSVGVSLFGAALEAASLGVQLAYNVLVAAPLSTFGEVPVMFLQTSALICTIAAYDEDWRRLLPGSILFVLLLQAAVGALAFGLLPPSLTAMLFTSSSLLALSAGLPQIWRNFRAKSTGNVSLTVAAMSFSGNSTRLFTSWVEVEDPGVRWMSFLYWALAASLLMQFGLYWGSSEKELPAELAERRGGASSFEKEKKEMRAQAQAAKKTD